MVLDIFSLLIALVLIGTMNVIIKLIKKNKLLSLFFLGENRVLQ